MSEPSTKGAKGDPYEGHRNPDGTLKKGHPGGPGNPFAKQSAKFRAALMAAVSESDIDQIVKNVLTMAKGEDDNARAPDEIAAAKLVFDRVIGPAALAEFGTDGEGGLVVRIVVPGDDDDD